MADDLDEIKDLANQRTTLIDDIINRLEKAVTVAQRELLRRVIEDFVEKLDKDEKGNIKNTLANKRKVNLLDKVYTDFINQDARKIANTIMKGVNDTLRFNIKYFGVFTDKATLANLYDDTTRQMQVWLGITEKNALAVNGYLDTLIRDPGTKNVIRDTVFKSIVAQKGFFEVKKDLKIYIDGTKEEAGALQKYYRNFVYDTISQVDRTQSKIMADKLKFGYAIYEGGLIKTSRPFCISRNGKVFTAEEIEQFDPPTAKPPNYNPVTDLGGYGCRHHLNWIPKIIAISLRPDLKEAA